MSDLLIGFIEQVILPGFLGYSDLDTDGQILLFDLMNDALITNERVTITAGSSVTGKEITYTLADIENWYPAK